MSACRPQDSRRAGGTRRSRPRSCRYVLRLGDTSLVLGQRLGGVDRSCAGARGGAGARQPRPRPRSDRRGCCSATPASSRAAGRDEDALAFLRDAPEFLNLTLAEQPNGDFAHTIVRQWLLDSWQLEVYQALSASADTRLAAIAAKALKETRYHYRFSSGWLVRLGDGTAESRQRVQRSLDELWRFTDGAVHAR